MSAHLHFLQVWLARQDPRLILAAAAAVLVVLITFLLIRRRRPTAEELERRRRERLTTTGRIIDGALLDARTLANEESSSSSPEVLVYRYRLAGVTYECAQDVSNLPEDARGCHIGSAVQVRYDPRNPGDSIVLAESWSGLWLPEGRAADHAANASRPLFTRIPD